MPSHAINLIYNPPSLQRACVYRIRQLISCLGKNVENNLVEKLSSGDFHDLRNPNLPVYLQDMCKYFYLILNHDAAINNVKLTFNI